MLSPSLYRLIPQSWWTLPVRCRWCERPPRCRVQPSLTIFSPICSSWATTQRLECVAGACQAPHQLQLSSPLFVIFFTDSSGAPSPGQRPVCCCSLGASNLDWYNKQNFFFFKLINDFLESKYLQMWSVTMADSEAVEGLGGLFDAGDVGIIRGDAWFAPLDEPLYHRYSILRPSVRDTFQYLQMYQ